MKLALSSSAYRHFAIEEAIARIASTGCAGIEILADVPHAWPAGLLDERKESILRAISDHKLTIVNVNALTMNAVADPRQSHCHPGWTDPIRTIEPSAESIQNELWTWRTIWALPTLRLSQEGY